MKTHLPSQRETFIALAVMCVMVGISVFIELLGWRIITPGLSLPQAWSQLFLGGVFRTVAGATLLGMVLVLLGIILRRTRPWSLANLLLLWSIGAGIFLVAMTALVAWAP
ncbi:hypothetical protein [Haliea sp. E1-2-M8]|uniref:hypothetical protein n=1 Tax=Haliea sp. E1-2-M8 TaxID=3064706 RepID=UPI00272AEECC|nr:hypothetical protein [Haliea sp. E1-2-M8]